MIQSGRPRQSLAQNLILLYAGEGFGKVLGLIPFGMLGHYLGPGRFGDLEFAISAYFVIRLVMGAGLSRYGAREAGKRPDLTNKLAGEILSMRALPLPMVLALLAFGVEHEAGRQRLVMLYAVVLLPTPLSLN